MAWNPFEGALDWFNEYNPLNESNAERFDRERDEEISRTRDEFYIRGLSDPNVSAEDKRGYQAILHKKYPNRFPNPHAGGPSGTRTAVGSSMSQGRSSGLRTFDPPKGSTIGSDTRGGIDPKLMDKAQDWATLFGIQAADTLALIRNDDGSEMRVGDYLHRMPSWNPNDVEAHQRKLLRAGFMGSAKAGDIAWGEVDELTVAGTYKLLMRNARYHSAGQQATVGQTLAEAMESVANGGGTEVKQSGYGDANANLRQAMAAMLGRKPNAREVRRFKRRPNEAEASIPAVEQEDPTGLGQFGIGPDDIEEDDDDFREGDAGLLAETEVLAKNGVEHAQYRSGQLTGLFEQMMVGGR